MSAGTATQHGAAAGFKRSQTRWAVNFGSSQTGLEMLRIKGEGEREREKKLKYGETSNQLLHIHYRSSIMFHLESLAAVHGCHNGCLCRGLEAMTPPPQICATIPRTQLNLQSGRCHDLINTCHANNRNRNEICKLYQSLQALFNPCVLDIS